MSLQNNRRVHITGGPGSGKTTLAHQLAVRLDIPCFELDAIGYEDGAGAPRPPEARLADIGQIAVQPAWVTEGIYLGWTAGLFEAADQIVWLDLSWRLVGWRIVTRHIQAELRGNNPHSGWLKLYRFMRWSRGYYVRHQSIKDVNQQTDYPENRAATAVYLAKFEAKMVRCQNPAEVRAFLDNI